MDQLDDIEELSNLTKHHSLYGSDRSCNLTSLCTISHQPLLSGAKSIKNAFRTHSRH